MNLYVKDESGSIPPALGHFFKIQHKRKRKKLKKWKNLVNGIHFVYVNLQNS